MSLRHCLRLLIVLLTVSAFAACGGGGGGGGGSPSGDGGKTGDGGTTGDAGGSPTPQISGFDFALQEGDFWEFEWDYYKFSWGMGDGSITKTDSARFRVVLGSPVVISGITAYPVSVSGRSDVYGENDDFAPRWKYLAVSGNKILGSEDGATLKTVFDAMNGSWTGGGFFLTFSSNTLVTAQSGTINNDYISGSAIQVGHSDSQTQCEYIAGVTICGDDSYDYDMYEYYKENIGPVGYYYYHVYENCGGGYCSGATWKKNIGLVASSLSGDTVDYDLEMEPNDSQDSPQPISPDKPVIGWVTKNDSGSVFFWSNGGPIETSNVEDHYSFTVSSTTSVTINLNFTSGDLDLFLITDTGSLLQKSIDANANGNYSESITYTLPAGTYVVMVDGWSTGSKPVEYMFTVNVN